MVIILSRSGLRLQSGIHGVKYTVKPRRIFWRSCLLMARRFTTYSIMLIERQLAVARRWHRKRPGKLIARYQYLSRQGGQNPLIKRKKKKPAFHHSVWYLYTFNYYTMYVWYALKKCIEPRIYIFSFHKYESGYRKINACFHFTRS